MKLSSSWLLPVFIVATSASLEASVYLLQANNLPESSSPPTLSPEQARLVLAQRLGVSMWHSLEDASAKTLSYINKFGGQHEGLFGDAVVNAPAELVLIVEGVSSQLSDAWPQKKPAFFVSNPPSSNVNLKLVGDISKQIGHNTACALEDDVNPLSACWEGKSKIIHYDLSKASNSVAKLLAVQKRMSSFVASEAMNVLVVLMPKSSANTKGETMPYGSYEMPTQGRLSARFVEEPMNGGPLMAIAEPNRAPSTRSNSTIKPITGVPKVCHATLESCSAKTNDCSGRGSCYKKRTGSNSCFACGCKVQNETFIHGPQNATGYRLVHYGGAACQKQDISGPFWLISIFTVVMVGLISWSIGLMYSIGEEQLPGVIGAGVSNNKAK